MIAHNWRKPDNLKVDRVINRSNAQLTRSPPWTQTANVHGETRDVHGGCGRASEAYLRELGHDWIPKRKFGHAAKPKHASANIEVNEAVKA